MSNKFPNSPVVHLLLIAVLGLLAYSNTFDAPFQWDENYFIEKTPIVKDLAYFLEPSRAEGLRHYDALKSRYIGYLSFALNYRVHGLDVTGYHAVNLAIHVLNALLVYLLVMLTFRTPFLRKSSLTDQAGYIALFAGLLFVSHPLQTEAVTYIFQRLASLAAFFYLASLVAYICARLAAGKAVRYSFLALSLASAVLAMKTKENAFTLPFVIALYEFFFLTGPVRTRMLRLAPFLLTLPIIPLTLIGGGRPAGEAIGSIVPVMRGYEGFTQYEYLLTQFSVVATYIRLLLFPVNQNIDYDYPVYNSFPDIHVVLPLVLLLSLLGAAAYLAHRSRSGPPVLRLMAFGVFWFFITLSVESSIIPIPMLINEYRVYLPGVGVFAAFSAAAFMYARRLGGKRRAVALIVFVLIPLSLATATYTRNRAWQSEVSLWEDTVRKSPGKARAQNNLGTAYWSEGQKDKAIWHFQRSISLMPDYVEAHNSLGTVYASRGLMDKAIQHFQKAIRHAPDYAEAYNNLGRAFWGKGLYDDAIAQYETATRLEPYYAEAHNNLGIAYAAKGMTDKAIGHYRTAIMIEPDNPGAHFNLGLAYFEQGLPEKAREEFKATLRLNPAHLNAQLFLQRITSQPR